MTKTSRFTNIRLLTNKRLDLPNDSLTGKYALTTNMGVPTT